MVAPLCVGIVMLDADTVSDGLSPLSVVLMSMTRKSESVVRVIATCPDLTLIWCPPEAGVAGVLLPWWCFDA